MSATSGIPSPDSPPPTRAVFPSADSDTEAPRKSLEPAGAVKVAVGVAERQQSLDLGFPQGEAGAGAHVAAAFPALEDELAGAVLEKAVEQAGGGDVEEGVDARGFQRCRLGGAAARDEGPFLPVTRSGQARTTYLVRAP